MEKNVSVCEGFHYSVLAAVYGVEFAVALIGNLFALWLLLTKERRNWHSGVVLSCNLVISDLLYLIPLLLQIIYYSLGKDWVFGETMCKIEKFLFMCNMNASIFIMAISVNRCVALVWPFFTRSYIEPAHLKVISVIIWITVGVISSPVLKFTSLCHEDNKTQCMPFYCLPSGNSKAVPVFAHKLFLTVFGCLIPFLVTFTSNCMVIRVVWQNASITRLEKRKVALLVTSVIVLYVVSFSPCHVYQTYYLYQRIYYPSQRNCLTHKLYYQVSKMLATLNMCIHPVLYVAVFDSIRVACCGKSPEDKIQGTTRK